MLSFAARQTGRLALGLLGAVVVAAVISAIAVPRAHGLAPFLAAAGTRLLDFARLNFGTSAISGLSAMDELGRRIPPTLALVLTGAGVALAVGTPLGLVFGAGPVRRSAAPLMQIVAAAPVFCAGLAMAYGAMHLLHWPVSINMPVADMAPIFTSNTRGLELAVLPVLTVGLAGAGAVQLALRRAVADSARESYRTGLKRMGLSTFEIEWLYAGPQVVAGLLSSAGEIMLALLSATVVAEWVFHRPGAADLFVKSVALQDWNMAALILFVFAALTFVINYLGRVGAHALASTGKPS
ncbi:MAG: ABC transporter permease subunit [Alphaproteobacteria bacterium]|nr:ABC transporter permease subunit [Alphaproteobacteria bacterium]MDE2495378.1 ABC transporter permease subunit [Alphaproteobacteria bacterium]